MIDSDRLSGLSAEEIEEVLANHNGVIMSDIDHISSVVTGYCSFMQGEGELIPYYTGYSNANGFIHGMEAGYWDKIKETTSTLYKSIITIIKNIKNFFTGEGKKQIDDATAKSKKTLDAANDVEGNTPVKENSQLLNIGRYFKAPSLSGLIGDDVDIVKKVTSSIDNALKLLNGVKTVDQLRRAMSAISKASIEAATTITNKINKRADEASAAAAAVEKVKSPKETDETEVKDAMKQESDAAIKEAKEKTSSLRKLATLRNRLLSPSLVVAGALSDILALKNKTFKG